MHIEKLKNIQETLATVAEAQLEHLECVDAKELGEVIDIIKDIEETIYYCTVTKAMHNSEAEEMTYCADSVGEARHGTHAQKEYSHDSEHKLEGKSYRSRKMYMEAKEAKQDKSTQMRELEKYMQELAQDVIEMVEGSSPEEKQYLSKKVSALATKLSQLND